MLESYMDGVYMMKRYEKKENDRTKDIASFYDIFQKSKQAGYKRQGSAIFDEGRKMGRYCKQVRPFDDLLFDLMKWKFEFEE